eukprot:5609593-Heterocapsa_arctica.AAC.1
MIIRRQSFSHTCAKLIKIGVVFGNDHQNATFYTKFQPHPCNLCLALLAHKTVWPSLSGRSGPGGSRPPVGHCSCNGSAPSIFVLETNA